MIEEHKPRAEERGEDFSESSEEEEISTQGAMIDAMRRYRATKRNLEADEQRAKEYLEQVKGQIELDLAPAREHLERLRSSMENFINVENVGRKFRVPGLGTAYTSRKIHVEIDDAQALEEAFGEEAEELLYESRFSSRKARKEVADAYTEDGELLPGAEVEERDVLCVRLAGSR